MNTKQQTKRMFISAVLAGLTMAAACSNTPFHPGATVDKYSSSADFKIKFTTSKVVITPNSGYAMVRLVEAPKRGVDNRLVWVSTGDQFEIRFQDIFDPDKPPPAPFPAGWNTATEVAGDWSFTVELDQGSGVPEIRTVKYSVRHITGSPVEDPVLIIRN